VISRFPPRTEGGEWQITANMSAGRGIHLVLCGTLTMSESEWSVFVNAMETCLAETLSADED
jgi:hypothetical protein